MGWIEHNAVKRVYNTFKRLKNQIYSQDVDALKLLNESIEIQDAKTAEDNKLYAKMLCVVLTMNLDYYKDMKMAISETSKMLKMPLNKHLFVLNRHLNKNEEINYLTNLGALDSEKIISEKQKEIIAKLNTSWSKENVSKSFYRTANDFLKDVENYE